MNSSLILIILKNKLKNISFKNCAEIFFEINQFLYRY